MPRTVIELGDKFGRLMNYGDGVYGGQFVGAMYAEAFFETDIHKIVKAGLACIPVESQYAEAVRDVIAWFDENPDDWQETWQLIEDKYNLNHDYRKFSCSGTAPDFNIDAKINGAYIVMGLLYGKGDMDQTILISMRCGQDSDCNPSNAAGILATSLGMENLPEKYKKDIDMTTRFSFTAYDFPALIEVCESLSREAVVRSGGSIEKSDDGSETFVIPVHSPVVGPNEQSWEPSEIDGDVYFTGEEYDQVRVKVRKLEDFVILWQVAGPYSKEGVEGLALYDLEFEPEHNQNSAKWVEMPVGKTGFDARVINLEQFFGVEHSVAYLRTHVWSGQDQRVIFELGSDDGIKVWLNDQPVFQNKIERPHNQGEDFVEVELSEGWNTVFMKISQSTGDWGASLVITDKERKPVDGLKYRL